jgi:probable F420-dependent oxidoreductase
VQFSLSVVPFHDPKSDQPFRRTFELCRLAESFGFDTVMVGHHHFIEGQISDPFTLLTGIASNTTTLRVATAIFLLPLHHPLQVAERVATLDQLSGGRVSLGVGVGWNPVEYAAFGSSLAERGARIEESLGLLRRLWTERDVAGTGRFWKFPAVTVYPRPVQAPHPPLWVAGNAPAAIDRAARLGTSWLCDPVQTLDRVTALHDQYHAACVRAGTTPSTVLRRYAWIGRDRATMERDFLPTYVGKQLAYWRQSTEAESERRLFARIDAGEDVSPTEIARGRFFGGAPDDVIAGIEECRAQTGITHVSVGFGGGLMGRSTDAASSDEVYADTREQITRFAREVMPAFASSPS